MDVKQILYQCFLYGVPLAVAGAIFGMRWKEGFWGNILSVFAVMFSMLIAIGWWEPLASLLAEKVPKMLFAADFICLWVLFLVALAIIGEITRLLSRVKVKFADSVEKGGNSLALILLFGLLMGFYLFALDLAPVGERADATPPGDSIQVKAFRLLTAGNLSSFVDPKPFDENGDFRRFHFERRQAIMQNCLDNNNSLFYDGSIPPRRN